jgi:hypothetical protein
MLPSTLRSASRFCGGSRVRKSSTVAIPASGSLNQAPRVGEAGRSNRGAAHPGRAKESERPEIG